MNRTDDSITQLSTLYERLGAVAHDWNIVKFCSLNTLNTLNNWILMPQQHMQ